MRRYQGTMCRIAWCALPALVFAGCGSGSENGAPHLPAAWPGFARDAQHSALGATKLQQGIAAQPLARIAWTAPVDLTPPGGPIHYGSPIVTSANTVIVPVRVLSQGAYTVVASAGSDGRVIWREPTDYVLPPSSVWTPSVGLTLTPANRLYIPGSGGKVWYRDRPDSAGGLLLPLVFYGADLYAAHPGSYDVSVYINTPLTSDASGNIFFGFRVTSPNAAHLVSGLARIGVDGSSSWVAANAAIGVTDPMDSATGAAPALSPDGRTLYVALATVPAIGNPAGFLLALDSTTLATRSVAPLLDPSTLAPAWVSVSSTATPMVGPDGDVYFGVLESNFPGHAGRGWLLHFDASLSVTKVPGSFGWDDTPSLVPAFLVGLYKGTSSYLLLTKYNDYADYPLGTGLNRMAILDPNALEPDPITGTAVMREVITVPGPTSDAISFPTKPFAVKEWCVNTAAIDPISAAAFMNSEDGYLYRWDLATGLLSQNIGLNTGYAQAYTPTVLGPDGTVYAINEGVLQAVRR